MDSLSIASDHDAARRQESARGKIPGQQLRKLSNRHLLGITGRDLAEIEWAVADANQSGDAQPNVLKEDLDFAVLAFVQRHRQPAVASVAAVKSGPHRTIVD